MHANLPMNGGFAMDFFVFHQLTQILHSSSALSQHCDFYPENGCFAFDI
jgi:hypothetical protein